MKSAILTIAAIAAGAAGLIVYEEIKSKGNKFVKEEIVKDVVSSRSEEDLEVFRLADSYNQQAKDLTDRETKEISERLSEFAESIGYDKKKQEINASISSKVEEYKESIGYQAAKDQYKKEFDDAVNEWKKDNDYISRIQKEKDKIDEVNRLANSQDLIVKLSTDDSEFGKETSEKLKETIKETKDDAIKRAKKNIKKIEKELDDYTTERRKVYESSVNELNKKVDNVRQEAVKESGDSLRELNASYKAKKEEIAQAVEARRTDEEKAISSNIAAYAAKRRGIMLREESVIEDSLRDVRTTDVMAAYFKRFNWPKFGVAGLLSLPLLPVAYVGYSWVKFTMEVIEKMK